MFKIYVFCGEQEYTLRRRFVKFVQDVEYERTFLRQILVSSRETSEAVIP